MSSFHLVLKTPVTPVVGTSYMLAAYLFGTAYDRWENLHYTPGNGARIEAELVANTLRERQERETVTVIGLDSATGSCLVKSTTNGAVFSCFNFLLIPIVSEVQS
jgi:hypothetical protein